MIRMNQNSFENFKIQKKNKPIIFFYDLQNNKT